MWGAGPIGLSALIVATWLGAEVAVIDLNAYRLSMAKSLGASLILNPASENVPAALMDWTQGHGVDVAFECVGSEQAAQQALPLIRRRGKLAYIGDGNNVAVSLLFGASMLGMDFAIAAPPGYELPTDPWELGEQIALESGSHLMATNDPQEAVVGADVVYTDVWASMGQEDEAEERARIFAPYKVNELLVVEAKPDVIVMHCLPAHRGQEITDDVCDGPHSVLWGQAENRMHAQKAILAELMA